MKTIAVDEETWKKLKKIRERLRARSYDEVIDKLIELWHRNEMAEAAKEIVYSDETEEKLYHFLSLRKGGKSGSGEG